MKNEDELQAQELLEQKEQDEVTYILNEKEKIKRYIESLSDCV